MTTKRVMSIAAVLFLVIALVPMPAFARNGNGKGGGRSVGAQHAPKSGAGKEGKQGGKKGKADTNLESTASPAPKVHGWQKTRSSIASGSVEASATPKLTGIANALSRIQRNLARMQAQIDSGQRAALPAGLVAVAQKFMSWLGLSPESGTDGTSTLEPTSTVEPTSTLEPTVTPEPTP